MVKPIQQCRTQTTTKGNCGQPPTPWVSIEDIPINDTIGKYGISTHHNYTM